jgi:oxalate---CoA ligase
VVSRQHIYGLLQDRAKHDPAAIALLAPGRKPLSYFKLFEQVTETAKALQSVGIGPGDRVAIVLRNGPEMAASFLSVAVVAACAPLNPAYRASEFDSYISELRPKALIVEAGVESLARDAAAKRGVAILELVPREDQGAGTFFLKDIKPVRRDHTIHAKQDDTALLLYTSGTTSQPKIVPLSHENLCHSAFNIKASFALTSRDRCLNIMPLFHIHGLIGALLASIASGASMVCSPGFQTSRFFEWLEEFQPTWYTAVPTMHMAILARAEQRRNVVLHHSLRFIRSCSAALPVKVMTDLERVFRVPVLEAYGMTEASHQVAANPLPPRERKRGSVGVPTGTEIAIMDEHQNLLGIGKSGEIVIRGATVTHGYLDSVSANERSFSGMWFRTGDIGSLDRDGYLFIEGRDKEIINRGGTKISPREVEDVLLAHPAILEAAVFAMPDARLGEEVGATVVLSEGASASEQEIREFVTQRMAEFKTPRRIIIVAEIAKGPTGKPQRIGLAEKLGIVADGSAATDEIVPVARPHTPMENLLARMWRQTLRLDHFSIFDNFFALGGDSWSAAQLVLSIEHVANVKLPLAALFEAPTIEKLAGLIAKGSAVERLPRAVPIQPDGFRPPFFCVGGGPLFWKLAHRLGPDQPFLGLLAPSELPVSSKFEDIAKFHVKTIRAVQPEGPYLLGGWCLHGLLAYEVAQQLVAQGQEVGSLILFDAANPARFEKLSWWAVLFARIDNLIQKVWFHLKIVRQIGLKELPMYFLARLKTILLNTSRSATKVRYDIGRRLSTPSRERLRSGEDVERIAGQAYRPQPYAGRVVLFRRSLRPNGRYEDAQLGWGDIVCGELDVYEIPGDHRDMFLDPSVAVTAEKLSACLGGSPTSNRVPDRDGSVVEVPVRSSVRGAANHRGGWYARLAAVCLQMLREFRPFE